VAVTALRLTGRQEKLYNLRVADYHTYFVGDAAWASPSGRIIPITTLSLQPIQNCEEEYGFTMLFPRLY